MSLKDIAYTKVTLAELEALKAEIKRLQSLVQTAFHEGMRRERGWQQSDARRALETKP